jgi:two-component system sensor histidine kinase UhpB
LAPETETAAYRIAQEALTNVVKHSGADQVRILAQMHDGCLVLAVEDNGNGIETHDRTRSTGLSGMRERAAEAGGEFSVESIPEGGTRICVRLPAAMDSETD